VSRSLLQLEDSWVTRLELRSITPAPLAGATSSDTLPRISWEIRDRADNYEIELRVSDNAAGHHILIDVTGRFSFKGKASDEQKKRMIDLNGPSILYGVVRGIVASLSGLTSGGRYALPSINFVALAEKRERQRARRSEKASS